MSEIVGLLVCECGCVTFGCSIKGRQANRILSDSSDELYPTQMRDAELQPWKVSSTLSPGASLEGMQDAIGLSMMASLCHKERILALAAPTFVRRDEAVPSLSTENVRRSRLALF